MWSRSSESHLNVAHPFIHLTVQILKRWSSHQPGPLWKVIKGLLYHHTHSSGEISECQRKNSRDVCYDQPLWSLWMKFLRCWSCIIFRCTLVHLLVVPNYISGSALHWIPKWILSVCFVRSFLECSVRKKRVWIELFHNLDTALSDECLTLSGQNQSC